MKYEYKTINDPTIVGLLTKLNQEGQNGWKLMFLHKAADFHALLERIISI